MTIANSTFSREPNQQLPRELTSQYLTDSIGSCHSSDVMPPSSDTWHDLTDVATESVSATTNVGEQIISINVLRSIPEPSTTNDPRETRQ